MCSDHTTTAGNFTFQLTKIRPVIQAYTNAETISQVRVVRSLIITNAKSFFFSPNPKRHHDAQPQTNETGGGCMIEKNAGVVGPSALFLYYSSFFSFLMDCAYEYPFTNVFYTNPFFIIFFPILPPLSIKSYITSSSLSPRFNNIYN